MRITSERRVTHTAVISAHHYEELASQAEEWQGIEKGEALRALLLAGAAHGFHADAFITGSPIVLEARENSVVGRSNPMTADEAAALIGLFLRLRGDFALRQVESVTFDTAPWHFYGVVARELLPASWRWMSTCHRAGDEELADLPASAIERLSRALRARHAPGADPHSDHE